MARMTITQETKDKILSLKDSGSTVAEIAEQCGLAPTQVSNQLYNLRKSHKKTDAPKAEEPKPQKPIVRSDSAVVLPATFGEAKPSFIIDPGEPVAFGVAASEKSEAPKQYNGADLLPGREAENLSLLYDFAHNYMGSPNFTDARADRGSGKAALELTLPDGRRVALVVLELKP